MSARLDANIYIAHEAKDFVPNPTHKVYALTTANRFGLRSSQRQLRGFTHVILIHLLRFNLSMPNVPGWLVSGNERYIRSSSIRLHAARE
jgi:hypothetical protein